MQFSQKSALFIPDIDKWKKWDISIIEAIKKVDYAFIDATFFSGAEIKARNISEIPHPFVIESIELFKDLSAEEKAKIFFIHLNHIWVEALGYSVLIFLLIGVQALVVKNLRKSTARSLKARQN